MSAAISDELLQYLLSDCVAVNAAPNAREIFSEHMKHEYQNGNMQQSMFYQVMMLFQAFDVRYAHELCEEDFQDGYTPQQLLDNMNDWEKQDIETNPLMQHVLKELLAAKKPINKKTASQKTLLKSVNFLHDVRSPVEGIARIQNVCQQLPSEWHVIQLCKGPCPHTTHSTYNQICNINADIYFTILHHARSADYPVPICLRFPVSTGQEESIFCKFNNISERFKKIICVDREQVNVENEIRRAYWKNLSEIGLYIASVMEDFKNIFSHWLFLFRGIPVAAAGSLAETFTIVDNFCDTYKWEPKERVLLSLTALHADCLKISDIERICTEIANDVQQPLAVKLIFDIKYGVKLSQESFSCYTASSKPALKHYPCILIVDERLDHFFWEALNEHQEFTRISSLQCLHRLYQHYKQSIRNGYLALHINSGGCVLNPDDNLERSEVRMKSFFSYWTPHWLIKSRKKPTPEEMTNEFFKQDCFVYAGHGSGLQFISTKQLTQQQISAVVFLFGCDSTRLKSSGLHSELVGAHRVYHAALCPAIVGTLMPGLDSNMDTISVHMLSHWIAPQSNNVTPWNKIEHRSWSKTGIIKAVSSNPTPKTMDYTPNYHVGSLCEVLSHVQQRRFDAELYNCIGYVCRGLPVWNCSVQPLPK